MDDKEKNAEVAKAIKLPSSNQTVGNRQKMVSSTYIYLYTEIRYGVLRRKRNTCANR